jgi:hypothetical protein
MRTNPNADLYHKARVIVVVVCIVLADIFCILILLYVLVIIYIYVYTHTRFLYLMKNFCQAKSTLSRLNILNWWKNYFSQLLNVHRVSDVRQIEIQLSH